MGEGLGSRGSLSYLRSVPELRESPFPKYLLEVHTRVLSRAAIGITLLRVLIDLRISTPEPPSQVYDVPKHDAIFVLVAHKRAALASQSGYELDFLCLAHESRV